MDGKTGMSTSRLLLVCMANICRSPTAEVVLRAHLERAGLARLVEVDSAGTQRHNIGRRPDARAHKVAALRGYDLSHLRARQVTEADFLRFDRILAMDSSVLQLLQRSCPPECGHKLGLFLEYANGVAGRDVPDPYYGSEAGFEHVLDLIEEGARGLVEGLRGGNPK